MREAGEGEKAGRRVVRFLGRGPARCVEAAAKDRIVLQSHDRGAISVAVDVLATLAREGLIEQESGRVVLSTVGAALARRLAAASEPFANQHREIDITMVDGPVGAIVVNQSESPLAQLARRKAKDGKPFLSVAEVSAGERLRADYTRGQIMPRLGANWEASVASSRRHGSAGIQDLTDTALAARQRVEKAIAAVGPELSGVLIDICCFLKGFEQVELERGWPARSAKVVLKSALGVLSRHYNPQGSSTPRRYLHWGAPDYRPSIG